MAAMIFDSGNVFRNTAGTGADSSSSIERFLVTRGRTDLPGSGPEHAPERIMVWAEFSDVGTIQTLRRRERNFYRWEGLSPRTDVSLGWARRLHASHL